MTSLSVVFFKNDSESVNGQSMVEKGLPPSRLMEEHAAASPAPTANSTSGKQFKCDQCDFASDSQRGLKVHVGRSHKDPEVLRAEEQAFGMELEAPEPAHPVCSPWVMCPRTECKMKRFREEAYIMRKRPCKKCKARNQDGCDCHICEDCNCGECCNRCRCCDGRRDEITLSEWKTYRSSPSVASPDRSSSKLSSLPPKL